MGKNNYWVGGKCKKAEDRPPQAAPMPWTVGPSGPSAPVVLSGPEILAAALAARGLGFWDRAEGSAPKFLRVERVIK